MAEGERLSQVWTPETRNGRTKQEEIPSNRILTCHAQDNDGREKEVAFTRGSISIKHQPNNLGDVQTQYAG